MDYYNGLVHPFERGAQRKPTIAGYVLAVARSDCLLIERLLHGRKLFKEFPRHLREMR